MGLSLWHDNVGYHEELLYARIYHHLVVKWVGSFPFQCISCTVNRKVSDRVVKCSD